VSPLADRGRLGKHALFHAHALINLGKRRELGPDTKGSLPMCRGMRAGLRRALVVFFVIGCLAALLGARWKSSELRAAAAPATTSRSSAQQPVAAANAATLGAPDAPAARPARTEQPGSVPVEKAPFDVSAVIEQARSAFEVTAAGFRGGRATYAVSVSADNTLSLKARHWQTGRSPAPESPLESDELVLRTSQVSRDTRASGALEEGVASLAQDLHLTVERNDHVEHVRQTPGGVEQSWEFPARPAGRGDLVVRVATSGLKYAGETATGLHFADARGLGFGYGHGTWIDATGAKTAVSARYHDGAVELAVPAELVERSVYPAVLDPVVGPEFAMDAVYGPGYVSRHEFTPDVVSNGEGYLVAWQDRRSGTSYDIYATRVSAAGTVLDGAGIALTNTATVNEARPRVASNGSGYLVVWQRGTAGNTDIYARRVSAAGASEGDTDIVVVNTTAGQRNPSVASNGSDYLIAWDDDRSTSNDIRARSVSAEGVLGTDTAVSSAANNQTYPTVASNGSDYLVAWQDARGASTDVYASRVSSLGTVVDSTGIAVSTEQGNQIYPSVASDGTSYLIVWQDYRFGSAADVYASRVNAAGSVLDPVGIAVSWATDSQFDPRVTSNGSDYLVAWSQSGVGGLDVYAARVTTSGSTQLA
jgi:hypothetical protein